MAESNPPAPMEPRKLRCEKAACQWQGDGIQAPWDGLRRDRDLWLPNGDCLVYLYDEGQSQRGPSMCIPYSALLNARCSSLTAFALSETDDLAGMKKLYLGAPADLSREEAFNWHVTTRNFFAWLLWKPLVGERLSRAMIDLLARMAIYRESSVDNVGDILDYANSIGYSDFACRPNLALAMLSFADEYKLADTWIDAFVHCVGMREDLSQCLEYEVTRSVNKALITRAALQMDLRLERATGTIDTLLKEDLSPSQINLTDGSRRHVDHFRSFLQSHFVASHGYWPVRREKFAKGLYESMHTEFQNLYDYLVDDSSMPGDVNAEQAFADGVQAGQIVATFDRQHSYEPLPHALPLLPDINTGAGHRTQAHWALRDWKLGAKDHKQSAVDIVRSAYTNAANRAVGRAIDSPLVRAFVKFEAELSKSFDDQLSFIDARKTRWIVVYAMLQTLKSITKAPEGVKDTQTAPYPLCCSVSGLPSWEFNRSSFSGSDLDGSLPSRSSTLSRTSKSSQEPWADRPNSMAYYGSTARNSSSTDGAVNNEPNSWLGYRLPEKSYRRSLMISKNFDSWDDNTVTSDESFPALESVRSRDSSETIPSLDWSRGSSKSVSSSDGPQSPVSASSSVYSLDISPEEKPKAAPSFIKEFFSEDGGFVCPGLSF